MKANLPPPYSSIASLFIRACLTELVWSIKNKKLFVWRGIWNLLCWMRHSNGDSDAMVMVMQTEVTHQEVTRDSSFCSSSLLLSWTFRAFQECLGNKKKQQQKDETPLHPIDVLRTTTTEHLLTQQYMHGKTCTTTHAHNKWSLVVVLLLLLSSSVSLSFQV